jgi:ribosome-binding factor A
LMANKRQGRLNQQFKREISDILRTQVRDPRVGLPTVTHVEVTPDLWMARVYVRPDPAATGVGPAGRGEAAQGGEAGKPGKGREVDETVTDLMEGLEAAAPFIRRELAKILHVRRIPELRFEEDRNLEQALRIERILHEVLPPDDEGEAADDEESHPG